MWTNKYQPNVTTETVSNTPLDSLMPSQNASCGQYKKTKHKQVSIVIFASVRMCKNIIPYQSKNKIKLTRILGEDGEARM